MKFRPAKSVGKKMPNNSVKFYILQKHIRKARKESLNLIAADITCFWTSSKLHICGVCIELPPYLWR
jgi:lipopolysaccharide biosynthesis glycosyltransferase